MVKQKRLFNRCTYDGTTTSNVSIYIATQWRDEISSLKKKKFNREEILERITNGIGIGRINDDIKENNGKKFYIHAMI